MAAHDYPRYPTPTPVEAVDQETEELLRRILDRDQSSQPVWRSLFQNIKDLVSPPKLPPLEVTSKPVAVRDIWGRDEYQGRSQLSSVGIHVMIVVLAFAIGTNKRVQQAAKDMTAVFMPVDLAPYTPKDAPPKQSGGGGGGDRSPLPASKGRLPRPSPKQFTPPMQVLNNLQPKLMMEPTILAPENTQLPNVNMPNYGDPLARIGPLSNGPGSGGGIGSGRGGGVGPGDGGGYGPGSGGGFGGGAFKIGGGVTSPQVIYKVEPEYSEEARKAKFQGTVLLQIVVDLDGRTTQVRVLRPLGMGLDEKAIEAVQKWRFKPGLKDGKPVPVIANVEVNFRLL